jgi:hypothetical protein
MTAKFVLCIDQMNADFVTSGRAAISADCLLTAEHLVLASWQYLSTVLPEGQHNNPSTAQEECQELLARNAVALFSFCEPLVSKALQQDPSISSSAGKPTAGASMTPDAKMAHAAVLGCHHMECMAFWVVILQLMLQIKTHIKQLRSTSDASLGPSAQGLPPELAAGRVPAPLHRLLQQLGRPESAAEPQFGLQHSA